MAVSVLRSLLVPSVSLWRAASHFAVHCLRLLTSPASSTFFVSTAELLQEGLSCTAGRGRALWRPLGHLPLEDSHGRINCHGLRERGHRCPTDLKKRPVQQGPLLHKQTPPASCGGGLDRSNRASKGLVPSPLQLLPLWLGPFRLLPFLGNRNQTLPPALRARLLHK